MEEKKKSLCIKVPVYVSQPVERENEFFETSNSSLIEEAKTLINNFNSDPKKAGVSEKKTKTTTIGINHIECIDMQFNDEDCLLLRVTAYKTNLIDGYLQSEALAENELRFKPNDKLCSDTYFYIIYPTIVKDSEKERVIAYWHIFLYEDPSKENADMASIARLIMKSIMKAPIKNIKSDKMLSELRKFDLISQIEIVLSSVIDDDEGVPKYLQNYKQSNKLKKERKILLENVPTKDAISVFEDESFSPDYSRRLVKFKTYNKRVFSMLQEYQDKLRSTLDDSFNYSIEVEESDVKNGSIFNTDKIKKNVEGIFSRYLAESHDD